MSIYVKIEEKLLADFNKRNGLNILPQHVEFKNPRPAETVDPSIAALYNTAIDMVLLKGAAYDGVAVLYYNRIVLSYEMANARTLDVNYLKVKDEKTTRDLVPALNTKYGFRFAADEIIDEPLLDKGLFTNVRIRAVDTSKTYQGSFEVALMRTSAPLVTLDVKHSVVWQEEANRKALMSRQEYPVFPLNYHIDYTAISFHLKDLLASTDYGPWPASDYSYLMEGIYIIPALNSVDNLGWSSSASAIATPNLNRAFVIYNGPTKDCLVMPKAYRDRNYFLSESDNAEKFNPANLDFDNVVVALLNYPWYSSNRYRSLVLFHYNEGVR